jgi:Magnesium chelatase, subunit ChlI C-terminal
VRLRPAAVPRRRRSTRPRPHQPAVVLQHSRDAVDPRRLDRFVRLRAPSSSEDSAAVRGRVIEARKRQTERYRGEKKTYSNAQMMPKMIRKYCAISAEGEKAAEERHHETGTLGARTRPDLEGVANDCRSGCRREHRTAAPERSHTIPDARPVVLVLGRQRNPQSPKFGAGCSIDSVSTCVLPIVRRKSV